MAPPKTAFLALLNFLLRIASSNSIQLDDYAFCSENEALAPLSSSWQAKEAFTSLVFLLSHLMFHSAFFRFSYSTRR